MSPSLWQPINTVDNQQINKRNETKNHIDREFNLQKICFLLVMYVGESYIFLIIVVAMVIIHTHALTIQHQLQSIANLMMVLFFFGFANPTLTWILKTTISILYFFVFICVTQTFFFIRILKCKR